MTNEQIEALRALADSIQSGIYMGDQMFPFICKEALPAIRQAIADAEAQGWQAIETAPKDGRWFLVRKSSDDFYPPLVVRWNAKISCFMGYNDLFEIRGYWGWFEIPRLPYSRPLPTPPTDQRQGREDSHD